MIVAYVNDYPFSFASGGKELQLTKYRQYLDEANDGVEVKLLDPWDRAALDGVGILHLFGLSNWFSDLIDVVRANRPGIRIVLSPTFYLASTAKYRAALCLSRVLPFRNFAGIRSYVLDNCDRIICNSLCEVDQICSLMGEHLRSRSSVLYNAIEADFASFGDPEATQSFCVTQGVEPGYLLSVGYLDERKNSLRMLRAYARVAERVGRRLVVVGGLRFTRQENARECEALVSGNVPGILHVPFIDRQKELDLLRSAYYNCAGHVLPSHVETPGLANLEAAAFGKRLLVGRCKPVAEYFGDRAYYCDPSDTSDIERGLLRLSAEEGSVDYGELVSHQCNYRFVVASLAEVYRTLSKQG
jgi:glycosyltransferase involved in cell wall biosynthesis